MTSSTRGIGKSVHSSDQVTSCEPMIGAGQAAGLTQHALARRLKIPQSFVAKYMKAANDSASTSWNSSRSPAL